MPKQLHSGDCEYVSECCESLAVGGEIDLTPHGVIGICASCRDPAAFICIECEDADDEDSG